MEKRVLVHVESTTELLAIRKDFWCERVAVCGHEAGIFKHRQVHVGLDVAHRAGITVPVPGTAEVAALFNDAEVVDTELAKIRRFEHAAKPTAHNHDIDIGDFRIASEARLDIGITIEFLVHPGKGRILSSSIRPETLLTLFCVLLTGLFNARCHGVDPWG